MWAALVTQCAQGHILETVACSADFCVDLKAALELVLIEGAKRAFEGEVHIVDVAFAARGKRTAR